MIPALFSVLPLEIQISDATSTLLMCLLLVIMSPFYAYAAAQIVFTFMWTFRFEKLREWFNRKAGMDVVPLSRFDKHLGKKAAIFYVGLFVFVIPGFIYAKMEYDKSLPKRGKRATLYRGAYVLMMMMSVAILFALFCWAIAIALFLGGASKIYDFAMHPNGESTSQSLRGYSHQCCYSCSYRSACEAAGDLVGKDLVSHVCSDYNRMP